MPPPIYFVSHGGPNIMYETDHPAYTSLSRLGREITSHLTPASPKIKGILVISAHWQSSASNKLYVSSPNETESEDNEEGLGLIYDFYGFPQEYYKEKYRYKSSRELAGEVCKVLGEKGVACERERRGLDHGVWVGFKCMFNPKTNPIPTSIPILQLSLYHNENAPLHYSLGKALAPLREQGYLIICSGMAVHNLRDLRFTFGTSKVMDYVHSFDEALREAVVDTEPGEERRVAMEKLLTRSDARKAHPTFEHLLPIYVAAGAAEKEKAERVWTLGEMSMSWAQFRFGNWS